MAQKFLTDIEVTRGLVDSSGDLGVAGQVLSSTGSGTNWITNEANSTVVYLDEFTGDNSTVDFTISVSVTDENITQVYIDGVYQNKDTYSVSGTTLTFSTAPPLNADIEVITFSTATTSDDLAAGSVIIPVKNTHTASIAKGEPVYITGNVGSSARLEIAPADASNSAKMPAAGLLLQTLAVNAEGYVITGGYLRNITTDTIDGTSTSSNDTVYVKSGGGLTMTKPTGTNLIQNIAKVARVASGSAGSLLVSSILRTNDVPNITNDYFWLGNSSGVATPTEFTSTARGLLSVGAEGTAAGDGNLAYNNSSGVFTYTPPVLGGLSGTTDNITEGSTNLYYTDARSRNAISVSGNAISYNSSTGVITSNYEESPTFTGNVTISGNLTVDGTQTILNTQTVEVEDNILQLNTTQGSPDTATATTSGISIYRGDGVTQASFIFDDADDTWDLTNNLTVAGSITSGDNIIIGSGGTYQAGNIYSDANWGMIFRALQSSPIQADFMFADSADNERLRITSSGATFAGDVKLTDEKILGLRTSSNEYAIQYRDLDFRFIGSTDSGTQRKFSFGYYTSNNPAGTWNGQVYINSYTGSIGIGTDTPSGKLHVHGGDASIYSIFARSDSKWMYLHSGGTDPAIGWDTGGAMRFGTATSNVGAGFSEKMRIDSSGNVGIGQTSLVSTRRLHIVGTQGYDTASGGNGTGGIYIKGGTAGDNNYSSGIGFSIATGASGISGVQTEGSDADRMGLAFFIHGAGSGTAASSEAMRIESNGNVGIGTSSPTGKLEVITANAFSRFWSNNASAYHFVSIGRNASDLELGSAAAANQFFTGTAAGEAVIKAPSSKLHLGHSSGAPAITIDTSNRVGIGVTSPNAPLDVNGNVYVRGTGSLYVDTLAGYSSGVITLNSNTNFIVPSGNVIVGGTAVDTAGSTSLKSNGIIRGVLSSGTAESTLINAISGISNGFQLSNDASNNQEYIFHNGSSVSLKINSAGNVGIGTSSPSALLDLGNSIQDNKIHLYASGNDKYGMGIRASQFLFYSGGLGDGNGGITFGKMTGTTYVENMRVTNDGNVGIGTDSPRSKLNAVTSSGAIITLENDSTALNSGDSLGKLNFYSNDISSSASGVKASINAEVESAFAATSMTFSTAGYLQSSASERMRIDSANNTNVSIKAVSGTAGNEAALSLWGTNTGGFGGSLIAQSRIDSLTDGTAYGSIMRFYTNNTSNTLTERMRIDSSGNVGIGTTATSLARLNVYDTTAGQGTSRVVDISNSVDANINIWLSQSGAATKYAEIASFSTIPLVLNNVSGGNVGIGTTSPNYGLDVQKSNGAQFYHGVSTEATANIRCRHDGAETTSDRATQISFRDDGDNEVGSIKSSGSATFYNTSSDYRLKQNEKDFNGLDLIDNIKVYDFEWKKDGGKDYGVFAHELQEVVPEAVSGEKDGQEMQGVDYSKLVPILLKSIQELKREIEILKLK